MLRIEENGAPSCELSIDQNFIIVRLPVRIVGREEHAVEAVSRYRIGAFRGREAAVRLLEGLETTLVFRIPQDLFRPRGRLILEAARKTSRTEEVILWRRRYDISRPGGLPVVSADLDSSIEIS